MTDFYKTVLPKIEAGNMPLMTERMITVSEYKQALKAINKHIKDAEGRGDNESISMWCKYKVQLIIPRR